MNGRGRWEIDGRRRLPTPRFASSRNGGTTRCCASVAGVWIESDRAPDHQAPGNSVRPETPVRQVRQQLFGAEHAHQSTISSWISSTARASVAVR
jgi:hypothetical protein